MIFSNPHILFFIWIVPLFFLLFLYGVKKRSAIINQYAFPETRHVICEGLLRRYRLIKAILISLSLLFMIFSLSGIKYGYRWQEVSRRGIDIIIALDCSKSMLATDISPTRLQRAKHEVYDLLKMLEGDRVGLVAFSGTAFLQCPLTIDYDAYHLFLKVLTPDFLPTGGTNLTESLSVAMASFDDKSNSEKAVILITDGENTGGSDPIKTAQALKEKGIKIFSVGVGDDKGAPIPLATGGFQKDKKGKIILSKLDEKTLKQMAALTGGRYVRSVSGDMDLDIIYSKEIRGKMDVSTLTSGRKKILEDRFQWPLLFAIVLILLELALPSAFKKNVAVLLICFLILPSLPADANPLKKGLSAYEKGAYEEALQHFLDAQVQYPDKPEISYNLGNVYYKTGDFESAYAHYEKALESENSKIKEMAQYNLGNASFRKGELDKAIKHYDEALKIDPEDIRAKENIEFVKKEMKKRPKKPQKGSDKDGDQKDDKEKKENEQNSSDEKNKDNQKKDPEGKDQPDDKEQNDQQQSSESKNKEDEKNAQSPKEFENKDDQEKTGNQGKSEKKESESTENKASSLDGKEEEKDSPSDKVLNRLKDQPGKAMIPLYQQQPVEKDW